MKTEEFIEKWKLQSGEGHGSARFDCSEELKEDLSLLFKRQREICANPDNKRVRVRRDEIYIERDAILNAPEPE